MSKSVGDDFFALLRIFPQIKKVAFNEEFLMIEDLSSSGSLNRSSESPSGSPMLRRKKSFNRLRRSSSPAGSPPSARASAFGSLIAYSCTIESAYVVETSGDAVCSSKEEARDIAARNFLNRLQRYDNDEIAAANRPEAVRNLRATASQLSPRGDGVRRMRGMSAPMLPRGLVLSDDKKPTMMSRLRSRLRKRASSPRDIPIKKLMTNLTPIFVLTCVMDVTDHPTADSHLRTALAPLLRRRCSQL